MLEAVAAALDARRDEILAVSAAETSLTREELAPEFGRMTGTFRMLAGVVRDGSWVRAAIDHRANRSVGPGHDVRRMLIPLGPAAVFGASNFPLAYGVCGGDTATALAAGCPVVVKEHPAHPKTGRLIASIAREAMAGAGYAGALTYVANEDPRDHGVAVALVRHPVITAVGFTGSLGGGLAIERLGRERTPPIPTYCEMGSVNPVVVTQRAAEERSDSVADALADSILLRFGQQCTCPGLIFVPHISGAVARVVERLASRLFEAPGREMLAPWVRDGYVERLASCERVPGVAVLARGRSVQGPRGAGTALLRTDITTLRAHAALQEEIFGPAAIIVEDTTGGVLDDAFLAALTFSVFLGRGDADGTDRMVALWAAARAGRVIFNGVPTGVRVSHGMVHAGPYPASNRPDTTAVGPFAMDRWCRPVCWQNAPDPVLPEELRDGNPRGIWRHVDGTPTRE